MAWPRSRHAAERVAGPAALRRPAPLRRRELPADGVRGRRPTPNAAYGPGGGFDCAPEAGGARVEPQYWFYRQAAELIVARGRVPGCI